MPDTIYREYPYPAEWEGDWYTTFVTMLTEIDADMNELFGTGLDTSLNVTIHKTNPILRFAGTEANAVDFRFYEDAGTLYLQKNTGTFSIPVWVSLIAFTSGGDIQMITAGKGIAMADSNSITRRLGYDIDGAPLTSAYP